MLQLDRFWLLTWTTYGTRLPGDARGFVSNIPIPQGGQIRHNQPGTPIDADRPSIRRSSQKLLKSEPILLSKPQADVLLPQFLETASFRDWYLYAASIIANHCHLVVGVPGDPEPSKILGDFKSYGSRALTRQWGKPKSGTWWTESGSKRKLPTSEAVLGAIQYCVDQEFPLVIWTKWIPELNLAGGFIDASGEREP